MSAETHVVSLEAEIAHCCHSLYRAMDPDTALRSWQRLRQLTAERTAAEQLQFARESSSLLTSR